MQRFGGCADLRTHEEPDSTCRSPTFDLAAHAHGAAVTVVGEAWVAGGLLMPRKVSSLWPRLRIAPIIPSMGPWAD